MMIVVGSRVKLNGEPHPTDGYWPSVTSKIGTVTRIFSNGDLRIRWDGNKHPSRNTNYHPQMVDEVWQAAPDPGVSTAAEPPQGDEGYGKK